MPSHAVRPRLPVVAAVPLLASCLAGPLALAQAPATEIFLAPLTLRPDAISVGAAVNVTNNPGYDNQPAFLPDSSGFLFSSSRDGQQTDIYRVDVASRTVTQVTRTPDNEYSPTIMPGGTTFSTVRGAEQRLWAFALDGTDAGLAYAHDGLIGYHAWLSPSSLGIFVLGSGTTPVTLQVVDLDTRQAMRVETHIGRSLLVRPRSGALTFVHRAPGAPPTIREMDPSTRQVSILGEMLPGSQDLAWAPDGRLVAGQRAKLFAWQPGTTDWTEVADLGASGLAAISRLAISPDGRWIAIVAEPARAGQAGS
ncbi:MAG TPA: hypothetical protein VMM93_05850 [Vicinamibacterales bacterium]|nr:hypothetical protein [Vicinamibacterales bacterium]